MYTMCNESYWDDTKFDIRIEQFLKMPVFIFIAFKFYLLALIYRRKKQFA